MARTVLSESDTSGRRLLRDGSVDPRPLLRGVLHQYSAVAAAIAGGVLVWLADGERARLAALVYAASLTVMFGTSAVYHRVWWASLRARQWMRRLDHSTIFLLIAGTYTPFGLLVLEDPLATILLGFVWGGAAAGILLNLVWIHSPRWATPIAYIAVGWAGIAAMPQILDRSGAHVLALVLAGGVLYTLGALVYARKRPDPIPASFGYHELFHALVLAAAVVQFAAVADVVT